MFCSGSAARRGFSASADPLFAPQLLATVLIQYERLHGVQSSGVLFIFWFLSVLCAIVPFRSKILKASGEVSALSPSSPGSLPPGAFPAFPVFPALSIRPPPPGVYSVESSEGAAELIEGLLFLTDSTGCADAAGSGSRPLPGSHRPRKKLSRTHAHRPVLNSSDPGQEDPPRLPD